ncbi:phosphate acetyltransferase [Megasphaera sueciensis]|uniref:phosphate acetyltransferase n=1 Tax=Megasphaera sueciensis TaxID=349094 RepID=UPI003D02FFF7
MRFVSDLKNRVAKLPMRIVLPESKSRRVLKAAEQIAAEKFAHVIVVGNASEIKSRALLYHINLAEIEIIDPLKFSMFEMFCDYYAERRKNKGVTKEAARFLLKTNYTLFAACLVVFDIADGMVSGAVTTSADVIRAALQIIGPAHDCKTVSSSFILLTDTKQYGDNGILVVGDCSVIPDPTAVQLADIACSCAARARTTVQILDPKVALLSYSTKGSGSGSSVDKVQEALRILHNRHVDFDFDGELQVDAAVVPDVGKIKAPASRVAGKANVLIFPTLDAANISYKLVQRFAHATALGPLLQGLARPVLDLSRGCSTEDIVDVAAICCNDAIAVKQYKKRCVM